MEDKFKVVRSITLSEFADGTWAAMACDFTVRREDRGDPNAGLRHVASCGSAEEALRSAKIVDVPTKD